MTRQTTKAFLYDLGIKGDDAVDRYKEGWTLEELRRGREFVEDGFTIEKINFKETIIQKVIK